MIDVHCHILPDIDDGAESLEDALEMGRKAVQDGVTAIVATPHHRDGEFENDDARVRDQVERMKLELSAHGIPLRLLPGQEVRYYDGLLDDLERKRGVMTLNDSKYLLLEFPPQEVPSGILEAMHEFRVLGIVPIIAHPERNKEIAADPSLMERLVQAGALGQVTSQSLIGGFGNRVQTTALRLCRQNLIHLVASDAHGMRRRPYRMKEAYGLVKDVLGGNVVDYYRLNAQLVVEDGMIERMEPSTARRKWWNFWKRGHD